MNGLRLTEKEFLKIAEMNVEALNEATAGLPANKVQSGIATLTSPARFSAEDAPLLGELARTSPQGHSYREDIPGDLRIHSSQQLYS